MENSIVEDANFDPPVPDLFAHSVQGGRSELLLICGYCYAEVERLFDAPCEENPEVVKGPIGMYHCPDCGVMLVAGLIHPKVCDSCLSYLMIERNSKMIDNKTEIRSQEEFENLFDPNEEVYVIDGIVEIFCNILIRFPLKILKNSFIDGEGCVTVTGARAGLIYPVPIGPRSSTKNNRVFRL